MKKNYKTKRRSAWLTLVLLMITALPVNAQNAGDRFLFDNYWYEVVDARNKTVKVTWANEMAATPKATERELKTIDGKIPDNLKAYYGKPVEGEEDEYEAGRPIKTKKIKVIKIPEKVSYKGQEWTVTAIGSYAFINERGIYKMVLPKTIEAIEDAAFYQCGATLLNFPENLKYIGWRAFYKTNLAPYEMEAVLRKEEIYRYKKITLPIEIPGETAIGPQAFEACFTGPQLRCPKITYVGYQAFKGDKFEIVNPIPASAKIGEMTHDPKILAMYDNLPEGTDPRSGVESFAEYSFDNDMPYKSETIPVSLAEGPKTIPKGMFEKAFNILPKFVIPYSVTEIEENAFANAGILSFNDLSVVKTIGKRAFENCSFSGDFEVLENVGKIGDGAFAGNSQMSAFILKGRTDCEIGTGILEGCTNLEYIDLRNIRNKEYAKNHLKMLSREFDTAANPNKTITAGLPTHTVVYLPDAPDITIAEGQDVNFVRSDGTCTKLSLQDGAEYEFLCDITANEVVYNRCNMTLKKETIVRGYNKGLTISHYEGDNSLSSYRDFSPFASGKNCFTIFLPYAVTLPDGIRAYNLKLQGKKKVWSDFAWDYIDQECYFFSSIPDGSTLEANRPYLLCVTDGANHNSKEFNAINSPVEIAASGNDKYDISGRLKPKVFIPAMSDQSYGFTGSTEKIPRDNEEYSKTDHPWTLSHDTDGSDIWIRLPDVKPIGRSLLIPPFRGIIMPKSAISAGTQFLLLSEGEEPTGVGNVTEDAETLKGAQRIYTIDGRYVGDDFDRLPSGIYIIKGNKTLKTK